MHTAGIVIKSNAIFTGLKEEVFQGGVAIKGNRIAAVGTNEEISRWIGKNTKIYEYGDQLILPGFIDAHTHFYLGAYASSKHMLTEIANSKSEMECIEMVRTFLEKHPDYEKITGMGWHPANWKKQNLPHRSTLDTICHDKPAYLLSADGHTFWLNSKALEECSITGKTRVALGKIGKDEDGELNGLLFEIEAIAPVMSRAFDLPEPEMKKMQIEFLKRISQSGITSLTNLSDCPVTESSDKEFFVTAQIEKEGLLTARLHLYPSLGLKPDLSRVKAWRRKYCSDKLRLSGLKQYIDGVTSTHTAYLAVPYSDRPDTAGYPDYPAELYRACVENANAEGFGVRFHAVGDAAVKLALDTFEDSNRSNDNKGIRNSIEHVETIDPADIPRFAELGVIASMQPYHLILDANEKVIRLGKERCRYEWPFRSLLDAGATLAFGTDYPVVSFDPIPNIYAAVTRKDENGIPSGVNEQERISLYEALRAYTYGGAVMLNREQNLGTIEAGKFADLIVLDRNIFEAGERELLKTTVELTMMDGKVVYQKEVNHEYNIV
jgi:hypothetical protein